MAEETCHWNMDDPEDRLGWMRYAARLAQKGGLWRSRMAPERAQRTDRQNRAIHAMAFETAAIVFSAIERRPVSPAVAKRRLKGMFLQRSFMVPDPETGELTPHIEVLDTSDLTPEECAQFFEAVRDWCAGFGFYIRNPEREWKLKGTPVFDFEERIIDEDAMRAAVEAIRAEKEARRGLAREGANVA